MYLLIIIISLWQSPLQPIPSPPWTPWFWWRDSPTDRLLPVALLPAPLLASPGTPTWMASPSIAPLTMGRSPPTTPCTPWGTWMARSWTVWCGIRLFQAPAGSHTTWWCTVSIYQNYTEAGFELVPLLFPHLDILIHEWRKWDLTVYY